MSTDTASEIITTLSLICLIAWWNDWPPLASNEVTTHEAACFAPQECKPSELVLYRTVYRADAGTLSVTSWQKEDETVISLFHKCAIKDKKNWSCAPESTLVPWPHEMRDGVVNPAVDTSWYRWWWLKANAYLDKK